MAPDATAQATTRELKLAIKALEEVLRRKRNQYFIYILILIFSSIVVSIGVTTMVVSNCLLSAQDTPSFYCKYIPGYADAVDSNKELLDQFVELQQTTIDNSQRLDELESHR